jgi:tRNA-dihydrouridine synthase
MAGARDGAAHLDQVKAIKEALRHTNIPIIANGNVKTWSDVVENLQYTNADGIMSAEGLLDDPTLFAPSLKASVTRSPIDIAIEYLDLVKSYPTTLKTIIFHTRRIMKTLLSQYQLLEDVINATSLDDIKSYVMLIQRYEQHGGFIYDKKKERLAQEASLRRTHEVSKRKEYEQRMIRKAKREKRDDLYYYLNQGDCSSFIYSSST